MRRSAVALLSVLLAAWSLEASADAKPVSSGATGSPTRRFALVVGENRGGAANVKLRYATSDAKSFAELLVELGGVRSEDLVLLLDQSLQSFRAAIGRLRSRSAEAEASGQRCELMLYYSGHSDEEGLLFDRDKLPYSELRSAIESVPAAVHVAILDSCSSGSLTRAKGGAARPAFLFDASSDMEGHAYLTSSSEAEAAQESDRLGGSFFTHHLVSALRGAADTRGQGVVTLNEAYAYAFRETLASTENTQYGPQHPAYEINLTGSGDLVFTDLRSSRAGVLLSEGLAGTLYFRDSRGDLALELDKDEGGRMEIGLPQGKYAVSLVKGSSRMQADVVVPAYGRAYLAGGDFRPLPAAERTASRGSGGAGAEAGGGDPPPGDRLVYRTLVAGSPVAFDADYKLDLSRGVFTSEEDKVVSASLFWGKARDVNVQIATLADFASGELRGAQVSSLVNGVKGDARGAQVCQLVNFAMGEIVGAQLSNLANFAYGGFVGLQASNLYNHAGAESRGVQLSVVNKADGLGGVQVGLVNVGARVQGVQLGLVNVAERIEGLPIGLVNIEKGGVRTFQVWVEGLSAANAGFAFGTRRFYTILRTSVDMGGEDRVPWTGLGLGLRLSASRFYGDCDLSWCSRFDRSDEAPPSRLSLRILGGFPAQGPGLIAGLAVEGRVPGVPWNADRDEVAAFTAVPTFLAGFKF